MGTHKVAISIEEDLLNKVDQLVKKKVFPNRSKAIQSAVREKIERLEHGRLARECAKLDSNNEEALAEEGLSADLEDWPEY